MVTLAAIFKTKFESYSGDLNSQLVRYSNGCKQFASRMVRYTSHGLNSELKVCYSDVNDAGSHCKACKCVMI